jgi:hypothetical protein
VEGVSDTLSAVPPAAQRVEALRRSKGLMRAYLLAKVEEEDWHGVQDAASDLRDIEAELKGLAR